MFEAIISDLYAGILDPVAWDRAMIAIADSVRGSAAYLYWLHPLTGAVARNEGYRSDPRVLNEYLSHWISKDIRLSSVLSAPVGEPQYEAKLLPMSEWKNSALDQDLRILEANVSAERLLQANQCIRADRRLKLPEPAARELNALAKTGLRRGSLGDGVLRISRGPQRRPLSLLIAPPPNEHVPWMLSAPRWLVLIFDPEQGVQVDAELLRFDLGVTRREAEVAALLATGFDLRGAATKLGISIHTARVHLKSVFFKTGLTNQVELVKRILRGPAAFGAHQR